MKTFLFQGDSITDVGRSRSNDGEMGMGYATVMAANLGAECPGKYKFINRGIGGNRVIDLYARIKADIINLSPDYMSILIGVNDVWHEVGGKNGLLTEKYEKIYSMLIEEVKEALPEIKIFILEPFITEGPAIDVAHDFFWTDVKEKAAAAKRVAQKYGLVFVPLQSVFDDACKVMPASNWTCEGVHPTTAGHGLIAAELKKAFEENRA